MEITFYEEFICLILGPFKNKKSSLQFAAFVVIPAQAGIQ